MAVIELRRRALVWLADYERVTGARHTDVLVARQHIMQMSGPQLERFLAWLDGRGVPIGRSNPFADLPGHHTVADPAPFTPPKPARHPPQGRVRFSFPLQTH